MDILRQIAGEMGDLPNHDGSRVSRGQVEAAVRLMDEGNTIPFIARYRKEATGALDDEQLRFLGERLLSLRRLEERKQQVLAAIEEQGKLNTELEGQIAAAVTLVAVEDLYRPYRPKRRTRADAAKEKGLGPFAAAIMGGKIRQNLLTEAVKYVTDDAGQDGHGVETPEAALQGALDIVAECIADDAALRTWIREITWKKGTLAAAEKKRGAASTPAGAAQTGKRGAAVHGTKEDRRSVYEMYYEFEEPVAKLPGHRTLAINRGEKEGFLTVKINAPAEDIRQHILTGLFRGTGGRNPYTEGALASAAEDAYDRLIAPSIEREIRNRLTEEAEDGAILVFRKNLEQLLMQPPIGGEVVLGWDPAFRTGCKIAVVDATGKVLDTTVIYPTAPQNKVAEAKAVIKQLIAKDHVTLISLGNGTASRESEQVIVEIIQELQKEKPSDKPLQYVVVNEAGASVYSASRLATEEFPAFDVGQRSAASMARRLQDPLAELVKIDPKAVGVGQYQHDMNQKKLDEALGGVVEDCVNHVGVDLNTASFSLLSYVSGISEAVAKNIVAYREANGRFRSRRELLKVNKLGPKAFEQCAGFLRIRDGEEPLDGTAVHPENYKAVERLLENLGLSDEKESFKRVKERLPKGRIPQVSAELGLGELTLRDILDELEKPARDPREEMPAPILRSDVLTMEDLKPGMQLKGTVRNIVDFGAFVDIGVHQDGLVHISKLSRRYVRHPLEVVHVGDVVEVTVESVDAGKKRIALSMV